MNYTPWELERADNAALDAMRCAVMHLSCIPSHLIKSMHERDIERLSHYEAECPASEPCDGTIDLDGIGRQGQA